jgi:hypothetical protein
MAKIKEFLSTVVERDGARYLDYMGISLKVKFTLEETTEVQSGSRGIALPFR